MDEEAADQLRNRIEADEQAVTITIGMKELWLIVRAIQQDLRSTDPEIGGSAREVMASIGRQCQSLITTRYPAAHELLEEGWKPQQDS